MPNVVVDLSARSRPIREEPWLLHFWENTASETLDYLRDPRGFLEGIGIKLPEDCRIETLIENHDFMARLTEGLSSDIGPICNVGGGDTAKGGYRGLGVRAPGGGHRAAREAAAALAEGGAGRQGARGGRGVPRV